MPESTAVIAPEDAPESASVAHTRAAFDAAAPVYDSAYEHLTGIRHIRAVMHGLYLRYFKPGDSLLELNCGTGNDAIFLARHGLRVHATDLSPRMIEETRRKVLHEGVEGLVTSDVLSFHQLEKLDGTTFDGAYSNFGGLNCTDRLHDVAAGLAPLLKPGAIFIAAVMTRFCLWESVAALCRGNLRLAFRRLRREGCLAHLHGGLVQTTYHAPSTVVRAFSGGFDPVGVIGLNVVLPPPNAVRSYQILGKGLSPLMRVDARICTHRPFSAMGDHCAIILRRR